MKAAVWAFTCGVLLSLGAGITSAPAKAQTTESALNSVVTLDPDRLFRESAFGRGVVAKIEARQRALMEENRLLTESLEAEERELTEKRPGMTAEAFAPLAEAFDQKAEGIRKAQAEKGVALEADAAGERQRFLDAATPVLRALMRDRGAQAIIDRRVIILDPSSIDITAEAVARMDAEFAVIPAP